MLSLCLVWSSAVVCWSGSHVCCCRYVCVCNVCVSSIVRVPHVVIVGIGVRVCSVVMGVIGIVVVLGVVGGCCIGGR